MRPGWLSAGMGLDGALSTGGSSGDPPRVLRRVPTSFALALLAACGGPTPEPERARAPAIVDVTPPPPPPPRSSPPPPGPDPSAASAALRRSLPPVPPVAPYRPAPGLTQTPAIQACLARPEPREASFCLLKTREEGGIPHLLDLGLRTRRQPRLHDLDRRWRDEAGGAENAGIVAAITSTWELAAMTADPRPEVRMFSLAALAQVPRTLQAGGYVPRTTADALRAAWRAVGDLCAAHLGEPDPGVIENALACVGEAGHLASSSAVAALAAYHPDVAVRAAAAQVWPRTSGFAVARPVLAPDVTATMLARLREPMTARWQLEDVHAREWTCHALWLSHLPGAPGVGEAAAIAIREMNARGGGNGRSGGCQRLAEREGSAAPEPKPVFRGEEGPVEDCHTASVRSRPSTMLCLESHAAASPPTFAVVLRDASRLDPATESHVQLARAALALQPGDRTSIHDALWVELDASTRLGLVPLIRPGARPIDDMRSTAVVLVDVVRARVQDAARTPWCRGCDGIAAQLSRAGEMPRSIVVIDQRARVDAQRTTMWWDGSRVVAARP